MQDFKGKVVFVTGATSGIGEEVVVQFAKFGANVAFTGRRNDKGEALAAKVKNTGGKVLFIQSDVKESSEIEKAVKTTVQEFGRIDIAVNNAGLEEQMTPFLDQKIEKFDEIFAVNVRGMWLSLHNEIRQMVAQNSPCSIINISSVAGQSGFAQTSSYIASKHSVNGLTRGLASEFAKQNIRINAVAPGPIKTEMWSRFAEQIPGVEEMIVQMVPSARIGTPEEVASAVLWLASDTATYVTGQIIVVDGGMVNV